MSMHRIDDAVYLRCHQYRAADNLQARLNLLNHYSPDPGRWYRWLFAHLQCPPSPSRPAILEVGCGLGSLWQENLDRLPAEWDILLSDFSPGMLAQTQPKLSAHKQRFRYALLDVQAVPFTDAQFDLVIANHTFHHVPDRPKALAEIRRILKPQGRLYASAVGQHHLQELAAVVQQFDSQYTLWDGWPMMSFSKENGREQMTPWFSRVILHQYEETLIVPAAKPLADYVLSSTSIPRERQAEFVQFVETQLECLGGQLSLTKEFGLFEGILDAA